MKWLLVPLISLAACTSAQLKEFSVISSKPSKARDSALAMIEADKYDVKSIEIGSTKFHLFGRKQEGLGLTAIENSLNKMWPLFKKHFHAQPTEIAIVDFEAPLGGGPLAPFVLGIFYSESIGKEHQKLIQSSSGWHPQKSTAEYIQSHYSSFANPIEAYIDDMLVHELGHVPFGWGLTQVDGADPESWWFSFGMGLLYDRLAWNEVYSQPSPLFDGVISTWTDNFSKREDVDQRLVNPNTSRDKEAGLQRRQTYGHGKAYKYLQFVREQVGRANFDKTMNMYVSTGGAASYDRFVATFSSRDQEVLVSIEQKFVVR